MLEAVRALAPRLLAASPVIEARGCLPEDLFCELADIGVFKAHLPVALGGHGATLSEMAPVVEAVARADGSAGWLAYVGSEAMRQTLHLDVEVARRVVASPRAFIAGMFTPGGSRAVALAGGGGYRVTGRWHTCSGSLHADWIIGGTTVYDGDSPRPGVDGSPVRRLNFIPISAVSVLDTWHVGGLRGTNSNDLSVDGVFVAEEYGAYDVEPPDLGLHLMVPLGIARAAMDEFVALAAVKGPSKLGGRVLHRDLPAVQREVAGLEARLRAARAYALAELAEVDARTHSGEPTSPEQRDAFILAAWYAAQTSLDVVDGLHRLAGTAGIFTSSHLLRCFQDVHVAAAHVSLQPINLEPAGRRLLWSPD
jgi:alkylation response protein AidB-like acyl-CoA dehydrogenase